MNLNKFQISRLSGSNFTEVSIKHQKHHYDVIMTLFHNTVQYKLIVLWSTCYQPAKFHWPRLSASNFTEGEGENTPSRLTHSEKAQSL